MSFLDEITAKLISEGVGTSASIFSGSKTAIPAGAGPYTTVTETGGTGPTRIQNQDAAATQRPTAHVLTRATSYPAARARARAAYLALDGKFNVDLSGTFYIKIVALQEPTDLGVLDAAGRAMISFNIEAEKYAS